MPASAGVLRIGIYDVGGRRVRALVDGVQAPGERWVSWDGTNDLGRAVPPGMYLLRMQAPGFVQVHRLVLTR